MDSATGLQQLCVVLLCLTLLGASISDVRRYKIPNSLSITGVCLFLVWFLSGGSPQSWWAHTYPFLLVFGATFAMFAVGAFGGGDVKLLAMLSLWAGADHVVYLLLIMALTGGLMAVLIITHILIMRAFFRRSRLKIRNAKLPYGVAISVGGLAVAWMYIQPTVAWLDKGVF